MCTLNIKISEVASACLQHGEFLRCVTSVVRCHTSHRYVNGERLDGEDDGLRET